MIKILAFIGTRPEAIKMAPVIKELRKYPDKVNLKVISTGQHREMLAQVCRIFDIKPDIDLGVMVKNQSLSYLTSVLFQKIDEVVSKEKPDWIMAQGDTTSVFVSSVVSFYHKIKFAHVEAGLRTYDNFSPFPEEFNRRAACILADINFAPTEYCADILRREGVPDEKIMITGNTVIDALLDVAGRNYNLGIEDIPHNKKLVLVTAHRRENFDTMREMFEALREIAIRFSDLHMIYPVHLNPNVRERVNEVLSGVDNIKLIEPLDYMDFVHLMKRVSVILTDSGGIQEEAPSFGIPVLIMRENTERPEGVNAGVATLVGNKKKGIIKAFCKAHESEFKKHNTPNPYGDGDAAVRITSFFINSH